MYILDTNILSELMRSAPNAQVVEWLNAQSVDAIYTTAITVSEMQYGVQKMPAGVRKSNLINAVDGLFNIDFADHILPFDVQSAFIYAKILTERELMGQPMSMADAQIAAIAISHHATLVTRNTKDFENIDVLIVNPF